MLQKFVEDYADRAYHFAFRLCGNQEEARELVQEAFFRLFKSQDRLDSAKSMEGLFQSILRNVYIDNLRRCHRKDSVSLDFRAQRDDGEGLSLAEVLADGRDVELLESLEKRETSDGVREVLGEMSAEHRVMLELCDMAGLGYEEISRVLDIPTGTVRSRVSRARRAFRALLLDRTTGVLAHAV